MRRQRYEAKLSPGTGNGIETRLILAYDAESVTRYYERCGYVVLQVRSARKKRTTERPANPPWKIDQRAIREACEFLGITHPVKLKPTNVAGGRLGAHQLRPTGPGVRIKGTRIHGIENATGLVHHITVKSWQSVEQASRTLWHELCHAMQAERELSAMPTPWDAADAIRTWNTCHARGRGITYKRKPIEVEAREYEEFAAEQPLARLA